MDNDLLSDGETIKLMVKPNAFLYALEATRMVFLVLPSISIVLIPYGHLKTGAPIGFATLLTAMLCCGGLLVAVLLGTLKALGVEFVISDKRVIARFSLIGQTLSQIAIPIHSITSIEVRRYGTRYGSLYLNCYPEARSSYPARVTVRPDWAAIWLSVPVTKPPMLGFYGFRDVEAFARLIVELQTAA